KHKFVIAMYLLLYFIASGCSIINTILAAKGIELITLKHFGMAITIMFIILAITVVTRLSWYITNILYNKYSVKIMAELNADLARQAFKLNSKTFNDHDTGTFVQRIVTDPERVVERFASIIDVIADIITSAIMIVYITTLNAYVSLMLIGVLLVGFVIEFFRIKLKRKNRRIVREMNDKITSLTTEIVRSEKDIKSLGLEEELSKVSNENYARYRKAVYTHDMTDTNFWSGRNAFIDISNLFILMFAVILMDKALLTLASFMIIYSNHNRLYGFIWGVGNVLNNIVDIKVASARMFSLFDEKEFVTEKFGTTKLDKVVGNIEFKKVGFTFKEYEYPKPEDKKKKAQIKVVSENKIFDNLSFKIPHNTTVAFVGKSGSGKSTILNLLARMYRADEGEVLVDGHNINSLDKETLRHTFSLVNQFPYIFDMSIKENLLLAKEDATDEEIMNVIKLASLDEFVLSLKKGIDTKVGESGIKLSGGQKQRLAIARALLRNSPVILFDESTSSLDNFAQEEVKKSIDGLKGRSTIIIVAHRLSTIKDVDLIFFLDEGKIIDKGTFKELYKSNPKFKSMFLVENT
ncbi:MAG: ABC transporter ATP-binding protein, partial [Clostridia bacterium]|nr:ABC transporter ATP-binding protein [Clostridia bacterium]